MDMITKEQIDHWASLCENENAKGWHPKNWKEIMDKPVAETIRQLEGDMITEMALPLKEFKRRVDGLRFQLIENWCLCEYCHLYDQSNDNFGHWVSEFNACARNLQDFEIKGGINKRKTIAKMLIDDYDYNQERKILFIIREKFNAENLRDMSRRNEIATKFVNSLNGLIDVLSDTQTSIDDYVQATFQYQRTA